MYRASLLVVATALVFSAACRDDPPVAPGNLAAAKKAVNLPDASAMSGARHYAGPDGTPSGGDGSQQNPWTLTYAFNNTPAGDTVWLLTGDYTGPFTVNVHGNAGQATVFRQAPGAHARIIMNLGWVDVVTLDILDAADYTEYWDFEIANLYTGNRTTTGSVEFPHGIWNRGDHTKFVNLVIHDFGVAILNEKYLAPPPVDVLFSGCIVYNNGWERTGDRTNGHGMYLKNNTGTLTIADNILFNQFGYGFHLYTDPTPENDMLNNIQVKGNISFNSGTLASAGFGTSANLGALGTPAATNLLFEYNVLYFSPTSILNAPPNENQQITPGRSLVYRDATGEDADPPGSGNVRRSNLIVGGNPFAEGGSQADGWSVTPGQEDVTFTAASDTDIVRVTFGDPNRANVVVFNGSLQPSKSISLPGFLNSGDTYEVRNVQDLELVTPGTYNGAILFPLNVATAPPTNGTTPRVPVETDPLFNVFVVTKLASSPTLNVNIHAMWSNQAAAVKPSQTCSYRADFSGGSAPYHFAWYKDDTPVGTDFRYLNVDVGTTSFTLKVVVTSASGWGDGTKAVDVSASGIICP